MWCIGFRSELINKDGARSWDWWPVGLPQTGPWSPWEDCLPHSPGIRLAVHYTEYLKSLSYLYCNPTQPNLSRRHGTRWWSVTACTWELSSRWPASWPSSCYLRRRPQRVISTDQDVLMTRLAGRGHPAIATRAKRARRNMRRRRNSFSSWEETAGRTSSQNSSNPDVRAITEPRESQICISRLTLTFRKFK